MLGYDKKYIFDKNIRLQFKKKYIWKDVRLVNKNLNMNIRFLY